MKVETQVIFTHADLVTLLTEAARKATNITIGSVSVTFLQLEKDITATVTLQTKEPKK